MTAAEVKELENKIQNNSKSKDVAFNTGVWGFIIGAASAFPIFGGIAPWIPMALWGVGAAAITDAMSRNMKDIDYRVDLANHRINELPKEKFQDLWLGMEGVRKMAEVGHPENNRSAANLNSMYYRLRERAIKEGLVKAPKSK